ncbi:MAG: hypothetical protein LBH85_07960 [Treponema sp.]|nr:hypothetical protein [Treponema sp.]
METAVLYGEQNQRGAEEAVHDKRSGGLPERLAGAPRTTNSRRSLPVFRNRVKDMVLTAPNQARAADITYIRTDEGFLSLSTS